MPPIIIVPCVRAALLDKVADALDMLLPVFHIICSCEHLADYG